MTSGAGGDPALLDAAVGRLVRAAGPTLFVILDGEDRILEANDHTRALLGDGAVGRRFGDCLVTFERSFSPAALVGEMPCVRQLNVLAAAGLPETYRCQLALAGDRIVVVGAVDTGEQLLLRRELLRRNQDLAARERELQRTNVELARVNEIKDQFIAIAAHDLRSPIHSIAAYAAILADALDGRLPPGDRADLAAIEDAANRMGRLVDEFLNVALIESGHLRLVKAPQLPAPLVARAIAEVRPVAQQHGIALCAAVGTDVAPALADGHLVHQVLVNLLLNAIQHAWPATEVEVAVGAVDGWVEFRVRNRGPAIPAEEASGLFAAFVHGADRRDGNERSIGLGLTISRRIVLEHGGTIEAGTEPDDWTVFTIRLPRA